jgi:Spy/CpxP family protein refolding chaperone
MLSKSKLLAVLLLVAVAATGFFSGRATSYVGDGSAGRRPERPSFSGMLQDSLGLTDAQRDSVQAILVRHRAEMQAIMESVRPRMDSVRLQVNNEIAAALPEDKRARFEAIRANWRAERARRDSMHRAERAGGRR